MKISKTIGIRYVFNPRPYSQVLISQQIQRHSGLFAYNLLQNLIYSDWSF